MIYEETQKKRWTLKEVSEFVVSDREWKKRRRMKSEWKERKRVPKNCLASLNKWKILMTSMKSFTSSLGDHVRCWAIRCGSRKIDACSKILALLWTKKHFIHLSLTSQWNACVLMWLFTYFRGLSENVCEELPILERNLGKLQLTTSFDQLFFVMHFSMLDSKVPNQRQCQLESVIVKWNSYYLVILHTFEIPCWEICSSMPFFAAAVICLLGNVSDLQNEMMILFLSSWLSLWRM